MLGPRSMGDTPSVGARPLSDHHDRYSSQLHHQNSTKLLINRFEILGTPPPSETPPLTRAKSTRKQQYVYDYNQTPNSLRTPDHKLKLHKKEKSPIRQSIKNLLSVLKKGTIGLSKKSEDKLDVPYPGPQSKEEETKGSSLERPTNHETSSSRPSRKKHTGSLLYLAGEQGSLAWTTCNVTLEENKIVLASFTPNMDLYVHEITLSHCIDIHSLSHVQLDADEAALLDAAADGGKMKVFEILFKGRSREKFATKTVRERAGWISAIWDAILPGQCKDLPLPEPVELNTQNAETSSLPIESPTPTPIPKICELLSPNYSDRSLPPLPPKAILPPLIIPDNPLQTSSRPTKLGGQQQRQHIHQDTLSPIDTVISPSIYPPTSCPTSSIGSPNSRSPPPPSPIGVSRSNSPSITNLSQLSVVRQRLAQIERTHSELSAQASAATPISPSSCSWSRREAVWNNSRASPRSDVTLRRGNRSPATPTSHVRKKARRTETEHSLLGEVMITDPLDNILAQHGQDPPPISTPQRDRENKGEKASPAPLRHDLAKISKDLSEVKGVLGGMNGYPTVHQMVVGLERRVQGDEQTLRAIQDSLSSLGKRVAGVSAVQEQQVRKQDRKEKQDLKQPVQGGGNEIVLRLLENIQSQLSVFPSVVGKLTQIADTQEQEKENQKQQQENQLVCRSIGQTPSDSEKTAEMETMLAKLEEIRNLCSIQAQGDGPESSREGEDSTKPPEYIDKILTFIDDEGQKRSMLMQQQADSVRYLNELNMWLEAFVNNGTSQIQGLATNIDLVCKEFGCNSQQQQSGAPADNNSPAPPTLLTDIRQLVLGMQARDHNFASLQSAVHGLLDVLSASHAQKGADSQAIAGLIDRQRRDQETLFRAFTDEISGEIKGERLRFVEAMKEATAINVQIHVEQFKQELSREVMSMTEEVGRLHREKQVVQNQISDLFVFYAKQKSAGPIPLETNHVPGTRQQALLPPPAQERAHANIPRSYHRPLPYPR